MIGGVREHIGVWIAAGVTVMIVVAALALLPMMLTKTYVTGGIDQRALTTTPSPLTSP